MGSQNSVSPHPFVAFKRRWNRGRCKQCYLHESRHPIDGWTDARGLGDNRAASTEREKE